MSSDVFYYSPWRYLHTMFAIAWAAFAHPFSSTVIDLTTGAVRLETGDDRGLTWPSPRTRPASPSIRCSSC